MRAWSPSTFFRVLAVAFGVSLLTAQEPQPGSLPTANELHEAVDDYLAEREDAAALTLLTTILARADATADAVQTALAAPPASVAIGERMIWSLPYRDQIVQAAIFVPPGHSRAAPPLPILLVPGGQDSELAAMHLGNTIRMYFVGLYTPPEFSDEMRDGFLKVLRTVAHLANGDLDRMWLAGFSWAGHSSIDTALHRPGTLCGNIPMGGGPRRQHFRLMRHLEGVQTLSFCGAKDDAELLWNLRELARIAPGLKIPATVTIDPERGHALPLLGMDGIGAILDRTPALSPQLRQSGYLLAEVPNIESPYLRIDQIDENRTKVPTQVSVAAGASPDDQRRAILRSMESKIVKLTWRIEEKKGERTLTLHGDGVKKATVFLRGPTFTAGTKLTIRAGNKVVFADTLTADPKTLLEDARRTGNRLRPALRTIAITF
ncbi:MAG: hypothetical protein IT456_11480 [Planctomycetes bacterium]|nr:hypothetical protein [Planctomycetota bacterium]